MRGRPAFGITFGVAFLVAGLAHALPPYSTVARQLERFREATGSVSGRGRLEYAGLRGEVTLERVFGEPPRLRGGARDLVADWRDEGLDPALRLVGVALGASDLGAALTAMGRPLTEQIWTLAFLDDEVCWVLGGALSAPTAHVWIERETYRLRRVEVTLPDGHWVVALDDYSLAEGWFPARVIVTREGGVVLRLELRELER